MGTRGETMRRVDLLDGAAGVALVLLGVAALTLVVRLGAASGGEAGDLLADLRARAERRILAERGQILPLLEAAARADDEALLREAEKELPRLSGNSQLHLLLAERHRAGGRDAAALREYRRAIYLARDYADRRSPFFVGKDLAPYLASVKPRLGALGASAALADLHTLERYLAGGCS